VTPYRQNYEINTLKTPSLNSPKTAPKAYEGIAIDNDGAYPVNINAVVCSASPKFNVGG
jgi:hypothetical protein